MNFTIEIWLSQILDKLKKEFGENLLFVGLQGSFNRGEATPDSDIDLVVILKNLIFDDLKVYKNILNNMPFKEKACGFISGKKELQRWSKQELFQFFYDTKSLFGNLSDIISSPSVEDVKLSLKLSAETLYHSAVHSFLHSETPKEDLINYYKMTFFILQAKYFAAKKAYIPTKKELLKLLKGKDYEILNICLHRTNITDNNAEIERLYSMLIDWCMQLI